MDYIIDYITFTIKPDKNSETPYNISFPEFLDLLNLSSIFDNFKDIGGRMFYEKCYTYNNISVLTSSAKNYDTMGFCVTMTGQGCRFFETLVDGFTWKYFFQALRCYVEAGCQVNISRIDFAFDDIVKSAENKKPLLNLNTIVDCWKNHYFTSLYRSNENQKHDNFIMQSSISQSLKSNGKIANTVYFGSRKSNSFCRFYDKLIEQTEKNKNNPVELQNLNNIKHWVRFEIVFKNSVAIKIINSMLCLSDSEFNIKLAEIINYYIRFINPDNDNRYKCSICSWWSEFLGTVEKAKLTCKKLEKNVFKSAVDWVARSVAPTLKAVQNSIGTLGLIKLINDFGHESRFKQKHREIEKINTTEEIAIDNEKYWRSLIPFYVPKECIV